MAPPTLRFHSASWLNTFPTWPIVPPKNTTLRPTATKSMNCTSPEPMSPWPESNRLLCLRSVLRTPRGQRPWACGAPPPFLQPQHLLQHLRRARVRTPFSIGARAVVGEELEWMRNGVDIRVVVLVQAHDGHLHRRSGHHRWQAVVIRHHRPHDLA